MLISEHMYNQLILENWSNLLFNSFCASLLFNYCLNSINKLHAKVFFFFDYPFLTGSYFSVIFVTGKSVQ